MNLDLVARSRWSAAILASVLVAALGLIYLPDVGHGFVKDDFVWIARSRIDSTDDLATLAGAPTGFFRPLVSLSFALNYALFGLEPLGYGLTNLGLLLACAAAVGLLIRAFSLPWPSAVLGAGVWAFNFHGINAAVLWISGRTALLLTLCAVLGAAAFVRHRHTLSGLLIFLAMLSKEEAALLPFALGVWWLCARRDFAPDRFRSARSAPLPPLIFPLVAYLVLRFGSDAFTPATAPPYYSLSVTPARFFSNLLPYADRAMTFPALVLLLIVALGRPGRPELHARERLAVIFGGVWLMGGFALTIFLLARSSLYVCFPSVGVAVIVTVVVTAIWREVPPHRQPLAAVICTMLPFVLWPIYNARNQRSILEAELSRSVLTQLKDFAAQRPRKDLRIVIRDDRERRPSLQDAFGTVMQEAVDLTIGSHMRVWIVPPPSGAELAGISRPRAADMVLRLRGTALERVP